MGCDNTSTGNRKCSDSNTLDDDDFTDDGTNYEVKKINRRSNGTLEFEFNTRATAATQGLTLVIDGVSYFIGDANSETINNKSNWMWNNANLSWAEGNTVSVKLVANDIAATGQPTISGEITQAGETNFHKIRLDPYKRYLIEAIGVDDRDMLGVEEHSNLTLANPDVIATWNAKGNFRQNVYATGNDRGHGNNAIVGFKKNEYRFYNIEVSSGDNGTGTYQHRRCREESLRHQLGGAQHRKVLHRRGNRGHRPDRHLLDQHHEETSELMRAPRREQGRRRERRHRRNLSRAARTIC